MCRRGTALVVADGAVLDVVEAGAEGEEDEVRPADLLLLLLPFFFEDDLDEESLPFLLLMGCIERQRK